MKIHRLMIQNYMSFGNKPTVIDFDDLRDETGGGLVRITGDIIMTEQYKETVAAQRGVTPSELDVPDDNGAGKSSFISAIYYAIFGEALRKRRKKNVNGLMHNGNGPMIVELEVDDVLIRRGRKPNLFEVYHDPTGKGDFTEEKRIDMAKGLQEWLEAYLGFDRQLFCSTVVFDQRNVDPFLESEAKDRRAIVENLLGMDQWYGYLERTRALIREEKARHDEMASLARKELALADDTTRKAQDLRAKAVSRKEELLERAKKIEEGISNLEVVQPEAIIAAHDLCDAYQEKLQSYRNLSSAVSSANALVNSVKSTLVSRKTAYDETENAVKQTAEAVKELEAEEPPDITKCEKCGEKIASLYDKWKTDHDKRLGNATASAEAACQQLSSIKENLRDLMGQLQQAQDAQKNAQEALKKADDPGEEPKRPKITKEQASEMHQKLSAAREQARGIREQAEEDPYAETAGQYDKEAAEHRKNAENAEQSAQSSADKVSLLKEWEDAFGDKGIRAYCVSALVGELNNQVNFWLQHLSSGRMSVSFDEALDVTVFIDGKERDIGLISNGEATRVDIAVYFAFADIMRMTNKSECNVVFLDEVGGNALDVPGKSGLHEALQELAADRLVAVITHDRFLGEMMSDGPEIVVKNVDGEAVAEAVERPIYSADAGP